ncbi:ribose transport ATP-binding protein RbsA [Candidatus Moduliflexus flocculans]|uniref:Autoinducer 2 import ATP-binding protein LsrA n=1 Tax=Candidatus Moduliflexus flocculans TaxID=1499966 RepID=A0A0S6W371_9BACT|nr:ribose transport ATP-binding protein RbsA [Candidatus Moduliflexus flocculans]
MENKAQVAALEVQHISKHFPGVQALSDVSVSLYAGEVHAIIGKNGAGKSTLMSIIFGLFQPDSGAILRGGTPVKIHRPVDAQHLGIGIVPQELNLVPQLSVMENITLGMSPCKIPHLQIDWKRMETQANHALAQIGEFIAPRSIVANLSAAQQQLVQIARAIAFGAKILIFDEPTASLALHETENLFKVIKQFQTQGGSVFYISHRLEEILEIADRVTVMRDGRNVKELEARHTNLHEMVTHMVGRELEETRSAAAFKPTEKQVVLQAERLSRKGEFQDISFELHAGEILGLAGLAGSGRTELVRCLYGDTSPDSGSLFVHTQKVSYRSPQQAIRDRLAYVPEERRKLGIFPLLDTRENITIPILDRLRRFFRIDRRKEYASAQEYAQKLDIRMSHFHQQIQHLSGGNQQKAILARWLLTDCKILILDEPTRGIDVNAKAEIYMQLSRLAEQGIAMIFISSELQEVINIADRILILHEGKLKGEVLAHQTNQTEILRIALS